MLLDASCRSPVGLVTLLSLRGVGPVSAERLAARFGSLREVREASPVILENALSSRAALATITSESAWEMASARAQKIQDQAEALSVRIISAWDDDYPPLLTLLPDRPLVLYVRGQLPRHRRCVACVGTREPSRFGVEVSKRISGYLAKNGWTIVSGLALGVDALSHQAALSAGGHTVAVLANGLDTVYPRKNAKLAEEIVAQGGALVSEQQFGTPAVGHNLVQRDRLQSGMSVAIVVMQTDIVGGTMHTVRFALFQGRRVFVPVPPPGEHESEPKSRGIVALATQTGAALGRMISATPEYQKLLSDRFAHGPAATPVAGRTEYERLLNELLAAASDPSLTTPGRPPQLGFFS